MDSVVEEDSYYSDPESSEDIIMRNIIKDDASYDFVRVMKEKFDYRVMKEKIDYETECFNEHRIPGEANVLPPILCPNDIVDNICDHSALCCAYSLLNGETGFSVDLNVQSEGLYPLHRVASSFYYELVDLLIQHGARVDVRTEDSHLLPLDFALEEFHSHLFFVDWTPKDSIYKLIIMLCLPQMKEPLEIVRLLSGNAKNVEDAFMCYAIEGKVMEMVILLIAAKEATSMSQRVMDEIGLLASEEANNFISKKTSPLVQRFRNKRVRLQFALGLLRLFEWTGDAIRLYLQSRQSSNDSKDAVVKEVTRILKDAGIVLTKKDITICCCHLFWETYEEAKAKSKGNLRIGTSQQFLDFLCGPLDISLVQEKLRSRQTKGQVKQMNPQVEKMNGFSPPQSAPIVCKPPGNPIFRYYSCSAFNLLVKARYKGETSATQRPVLPYKSGNLLASFSLIFKRGMRLL